MHSSLKVPCLAMRSPQYSYDAKFHFLFIGSPSTGPIVVYEDVGPCWLSADKPSGIRGAEGSSQQRRILSLATGL